MSIVSHRAPRQHGRRPAPGGARRRALLQGHRHVAGRRDRLRRRGAHVRRRTRRSRRTRRRPRWSAPTTPALAGRSGAGAGLVDAAAAVGAARDRRFAARPANQGLRRSIRHGLARLEPRLVQAVHGLEGGRQARAALGRGRRARNRLGLRRVGGAAVDRRPTWRCVAVGAPHRRWPRAGAVRRRPRRGAASAGTRARGREVVGRRRRSRRSTGSPSPGARRCGTGRADVSARRRRCRRAGRRADRRRRRRRARSRPPAGSPTSRAGAPATLLACAGHPRRDRRVPSASRSSSTTAASGRSTRCPTRSGPARCCSCARASLALAVGRRRAVAGQALLRRPPLEGRLQRRAVRARDHRGARGVRRARLAAGRRARGVAGGGASRWPPSRRSTRCSSARSSRSPSAGRSGRCCSPARD